MREKNQRYHHQKNPINLNIDMWEYVHIFYGSNHKELLVVVTFGEINLRESVRERPSFFILDIFLG